MNIYETVRDYAHSKIARLDRYYDQVQHIELILSREGNDKIAEMIIKARVGGQFVGKEKAEEFFAAIDLLVDKMSRQLKKQKEKLRLPKIKIALFLKSYLDDIKLVVGEDWK